MNRQRLITLVFALFLSAGMALTGCASPTVYQMQSGERTAGAAGEMTITKDSNGNHLVQLTVAHLPQPSQLSEQMSTYIVWIAPEGSGQRYNMGRLRLGDDRTGNLLFTTPFDAYDILVTAEAKSTEMSPSDQVVLRYTVGGAGKAGR